NGTVVPVISGNPPPTTPSPSPSPTHSPSHSPTPTPAPSGTPSERITNGTFEGSLAGWTLGGAKNPIDSGAEAHSGSKSLRAGATTSADVNGDSWAYQDVDLPAGAAATLSFWSYAASGDPQNDWQAAEVRDTGDATLKTVFKGGDDSQSWTQHTVDLSPWAGTTVRIWFGTHGNGDALTTTLWVDDVSVLAN
ncbi:MAG TPA: carbohydrate binding domain-containing protein, partial [bacterium]|nr:carbohydrate binding domain-containing protein [bacterium]